MSYTLFVKGDWTWNGMTARENHGCQAKAAGRAIYKMDVYAIKILSEIELVSLQVISHQNRITAAELFNIDKRLLFAMVQAITAYYIILVQLYPNQNK
ncbi:unnamed protein product [Acanthoscelides obtectus]|uniref:Uncharacterized protein n=1 Tax=Acanthoscelides obtectus TaxID=200917 RepID=A0A9P0K7F1_ACAOB|nr:unnamed protein product [Acanthoscelides obtectus]CAK1629110.1 hypothetical protein AOBTE_LOCUS5585 [Acanthoscelides obtectus]